MKSVEDSGGLELETMNDDVRAIASASKQLLPPLFKFVTDTHAAFKHEKQQQGNDSMSEEKSEGQAVDGFQKLHTVTETISSLTRLAPRDFVQDLFKKVMHRLLDEYRSETGDNERVCALLTLSQSVVGVLDESSVSFLYRALKPLIRDDGNSHRVQKRAYKVLCEICQQHWSFVSEPEQLKEISALLSNTILTSQVSARYMRLKCMNIIVDGFESETKDDLVSMFYVCWIGCSLIAFYRNLYSRLFQKFFFV